MTTAIYPNRLRDKARVEAIWGWKEDGDNESSFFLPGGSLFAVGYSRIVYGDHGPYIEFDASHIRMPLEKRYPDPQSPHIYYVWLYPVGYHRVKVYYQVKDVRNLANAPIRKDGQPSKFNRKEGYADYIVGKYYVAPEYFVGSQLTLF